MRLDLFLKAHGFAESREKAQTLISSGVVYVNGKNASKASLDTAENAAVEIRGEAPELKYVSRGGLKLEYALDFFGIDVSGMKAVDIGASTGGFTDCLLKRGAERVVAVDCGSGQLHESLVNDKRVKSVENFNARSLTGEVTDGRCGIAVADVSFISQKLLYPAISDVLMPDGIYVGLIKPQFEAGRANIGKNGIVTDEKVRQNVISDIRKTAEIYGLVCEGVVKSPIRGGDGNVEFLGYFRFDKSISDKRK